VQRDDLNASDREAANFAKLQEQFDEEMREFQVSTERFETFNRIMAGETDENALTDAVFYGRHPRLKGHALDPNNPSERGYVDDWLSIREHIVRVELRKLEADQAKAAAAGDATAPGM
jgi:hypothetical protein